MELAMNFIEENPLASMAFGAPFLFIVGLLLTAAFRGVKPSPRWPSSKLLMVACWSFLGFITGASFAVIFLNLSEMGWFDGIYRWLPAGWREFQTMSTIVGGVWVCGLLGAWVGRLLWQRRFHGPH
jgi:hypothetical protein